MSQQLKAKSKFWHMIMKSKCHMRNCLRQSNLNHSRPIQPYNLTKKIILMLYALKTEINTQHHLWEGLQLTDSNRTHSIICPKLRCSRLTTANTNYRARCNLAKTKMRSCALNSNDTKKSTDLTSQLYGYRGSEKCSVKLLSNSVKLHWVWRKHWNNRLSSHSGIRDLCKLRNLNFSHISLRNSYQKETKIVWLKSKTDTVSLWDT